MTDPIIPMQLQGMRFKGDRDYLHGTDILPIALHALCDLRPLDAARDVDIVFHGLARQGLTLRSDTPPGSEARVQLACTIDGVRRKFVLVEDGRPITERHPYPENKIVAATTVDANAGTATSVRYLPFTNIERWIAMVKALHHAVYPQASGKWLFARARLISYRDVSGETGEHGVKLEADFSGKLTRSALTVDGQRLGDIFFALA